MFHLCLPRAKLRILRENALIFRRTTKYRISNFITHLDRNSYFPSFFYPIGSEHYIYCYGVTKVAFLNKYPCARFHISIVAAGILLLTLCRHSSAMLTVSSIEGTVVDKESGQPLAYCNIVIAATSMGTMTRRDGSYRIDGIPPGAYTVKAMMMGYETESICRIDVEEGKCSFLSFELEPRRELEEIIIGPCGLPACTLHGVDLEDFVMIKLPVIDTAISHYEAYEKTRLERFPHGDLFILDSCLSQSTDSALVSRCPGCAEQARIWSSR